MFWLHYSLKKVILGGYGCVNQDYYSSHSIYIYQIITLYTLNFLVLYINYISIKLGEKEMQIYFLFIKRNVLRFLK